MKKIIILWGVLLLFTSSSCQSKDSNELLLIDKLGFDDTGLGGEITPNDEPEFDDEPGVNSDLSFIFSTPGAGLRLRQTSKFTTIFSDTNLNVANPGIEYRVGVSLPGTLNVGTNSTNTLQTLRDKDDLITLVGNEVYLNADAIGDHELALEVNYTEGADTTIRQLSSNIILQAKNPVTITSSVDDVIIFVNTEIEFTLGEDLEFNSDSVRVHLDTNTIMPGILRLSTSLLELNPIILDSNVSSVSEELVNTTINGNKMTFFINAIGRGDYTFKLEVDVKKTGETDSAKTITDTITINSAFPTLPIP